ncbi:MAG: DUF4870 domain-containing protein [Nanoarchaeota archaeon]|nr:DUF4870 domain-containing protein [Nanoarchaeota archaeon]
MAKENSGLAGVMYLLSLILGVVGWVIAIIIWAAKKDDKLINYHFKQLLILWIASIVIGVVGAVTSVILIGLLILVAGGIFILVLWIIGIVNAFSGKMKPLPVIGKWGESWFKF